MAQAADTRPHCVFCGAEWSAEMLRLYDLGANGAVCSCCVIFPDFEPPAEPEPEPEPQVHVALPAELSCETCGRVLYRLAGPDSPDEAALKA